MKTKTILILIFFLFIIKRTDAQCAAITCTTSNGININPLSTMPPVVVDTVHVATIDSMSLFVMVSNCAMGYPGISVNGTPATYVVKGAPNLINVRHVRLLSLPGTYSISVHAGPLLSYDTILKVSFTLILDPVGMPEISTIADKSISVFPNPATDILSVLSKIHELKTIFIHNAFGEEMGGFNATGHTFEIPLTEYPPGIYFIHIATLSDKIIIKKITVL